MLALLIQALRSARDARKRGRTALIGAFWLVLILAADARIQSFDLSSDEASIAVIAAVVATEYLWAKVRVRLGLAPFDAVPMTPLPFRSVETEVPPFGPVKPYKPPR